MIDLSTANIALIVGTLACYLVFMCLFITGSDADDEMEKMGRIYRVK